MKYKIYREVPKNQIENYVPPRYLSTVPSSWPENVTIVVFKTSRDAVILSKTVENALRDEDLENQENIVALGDCFTIESVQVLKDRRISYISISDFPWTDENYRQISMNSKG